MKFVFKYIKANRDRLGTMLVLQGGVFVLGVLLVIFINASINQDPDYAAIGGMMALFCTAFTGLVYGFGIAGVHYGLAISMGQTRRDYILAAPLCSALFTLLGVAVAWVLTQLEKGLYRLVYPGYTCELDILAMVPWWGLALGVLGVVVAEFLLGAMGLRFGQKGLLFVWLPLCLAPSLLGNSVSAARKGGTSLLAGLGRGILWLVQCLSPTAWAALGAVVLVALLALSVHCYRRAEVKL